MSGRSVITHRAPLVVGHASNLVFVLQIMRGYYVQQFHNNPKMTATPRCHQRIVEYSALGSR